MYIQKQRINNVHVCDQTEMYMTPYIQYIQKINQDLVNPEKHSPGIWNDMQVQVTLYHVIIYYMTVYMFMYNSTVLLIVL